MKNNTTQQSSNAKHIPILYGKTHETMPILRNKVGDEKRRYALYTQHPHGDYATYHMIYDDRHLSRTNR